MGQTIRVRTVSLKSKINTIPGGVAMGGHRPMALSSQERKVRVVQLVVNCVLNDIL